MSCVDCVVTDRDVRRAVFKNGEHFASERSHQSNALADTKQCEADVTERQVSRPAHGGLRRTAVERPTSPASDLTVSVVWVR